MASYSNRSLLIPESAAESPPSHLTWFYPEELFASPKSNSGSSDGTQLSHEPGSSVAPISAIPAPVEQPVKEESSNSKTSKARKATSNKAHSKALKPNQSKKMKKKTSSCPEAKREKKDLNVDFHHADFDFSGVPSPVCSCTGVPRVCYKWGAGGWQSSCCTINISEYPLPMSSTRPGARVAGRKMSNGAYTKLLHKLAAEGCDLFCPVDLKDHWARHGTNKFVTIK
ncbi:unnamed protein product [Linum trigynum]|uniref:GAGA-binding transcriptional activator n=1 Tax=Linum trigynum TaxID=586398 RepID=A0AAV2DRH9_9ROSI